MAGWTTVWFVCLLCLVPARARVSLPQQPYVTHDREEASNIFAFDDIWKEEYQPKYFNGRWHKDALLHQDHDGNLVMGDLQTHETRLLVNGSVFEKLGATSYSVSPDDRYVLLAYNSQQVWRHSSTAKYKLYDTEAEEENSVIDFPSSSALKGAVLQFAGWSPEGLGLTFVHKHDLYYQDGADGNVTRITDTGTETDIFNGIPDWLYEEDVLVSNIAHYWSPTAQRLLYATFNDSDVPRIEYPWYGPKAEIYSRTVRIAYPKAGDKSKDGGPGPNSRAELYVVARSDLLVGEINAVRIHAPAELENEDHYFTRVTWQDDDHVMVVWTNRVQNVSLICICTMTPLYCEKSHVQTTVGGWTVVPWPELRFTEGGSGYLTLLPKNEAEKGDFQQVALVVNSSVCAPPQSSSPLVVRTNRYTLRTITVDVEFLTSGAAEVTSITGYDKSRHLVYYISTGGDARKHHLYRVGLPGADSDKMAAKCLTCGMSADCQYVYATFNPNATYALLHCAGPGVPTDTLYDVINDKRVSLEDNAKLKESISQKSFPTREFFEIDVEGGYKALASIYLPPGHSSNPGRKYPLLIKTYGGPGAQEVLDYFPLGSAIANWIAHLGSAHQVAVASIDGRGSGGRGDKYKFELHRRMGTVEVEDQARAQSYFAEKDYIDDTKASAIYGWSYGGEVSSHALGTYPGFTCAIAVAPVTSKRYYDTAYTERVMGFDSPNDNEAGYNATDIMQKVANFKNKKYAVAHGTADDNVHFMNTAQMLQALTQEEVQFRNLVYIDQNHAIKDEHASRHLLRALTDFLVKDCWDMSRDHDGGAGDDSRSNGATSVFSRLLMISGVILTGACSLGFCLAC